MALPYAILVGNSCIRINFPIDDDVQLIPLDFNSFFLADLYSYDPDEVM